MSSESERWTREERLHALDAFFESEDGRRFLDVFSRDCTAEDREIFLRDTERRSRFGEEVAGHWWDSLRALVKSEPHRHLALVEPLAQNGITIEELYDCLPDDFDPPALLRAIGLSRDVQSGVKSRLSPGITNAAGWTDEQIRSRLEAIKAQLDWENTDGNARQWWETFENESWQRLGLVLRLAEELVNRKATVAEFHKAFTHANTENIQAVLYYLDYTRLKQKEAAQPAVAGGSGLTSSDRGWWWKLAPRVTRVRGWTEEQIRSRLEEVKTELDWKNAAIDVRVWWEAFEQENQHRPALVLRLAEELANRKATITEFHRTAGLSTANDIQANLSYLDYTRLTTEEYEYETVMLGETGETKERRWCKARRFVEELAPGVNLEMVQIPGGKFLMGSPENEAERSNSEGPQHEVIVPPFYIGKFTITQEQWNVVAGWEKVERDLKPDPSNFKGDDRPVEKISWFDAKEFCARLAKKTDRTYRLPTEAEWEYACRAGTTTPFAFGETITPEIVNYDGNYPYAKAKKGKFRNETLPVGSLGMANAFGLFDMHGNVWEWCEDVWHDNYHDAPTDGSAWLSGGDSSRLVLRGGSYYDSARLCRAANRALNGASGFDRHVGLRVVVSARIS